MTDKLWIIVHNMMITLIWHIKLGLILHWMNMKYEWIAFRPQQPVYDEAMIGLDIGPDGLMFDLILLVLDLF